VRGRLSRLRLLLTFAGEVLNGGDLVARTHAVRTAVHAYAQTVLMRSAQVCPLVR
jgi:hypothetical protein